MQAMKTLDQKIKISAMLGAPFIALVAVLIYVAVVPVPSATLPVLMLLVAAVVSGVILFSGVGGGAADPEALRNKSKVVALNRVQAVIEFTLDGNIVDANENFLSLMGYSLAEVKGRHHSIFVDEAQRTSAEYRQFWAELNRGEYKINEFKRVKKNGEEVWIHGSYNPIFDAAGVPVAVVKFATDITARKKQEAINLRHANTSSALQLCQANVMLADQDLNIVYLNDCVKEMLAKRETQIRTALPDFRVDKLIGTCVDSFHVNPRHQRSIINELKEPFNTDLNLAGLVFGLVATPWFDLDGKRIGTVVEWDDKTDRVHKEKEEREIAAENARVRQALDNVSTNVMIADVDFNIIYINDSAVGMMRNAESDIRKDLKNFDASRLMGANIDTFHKNPAHQRRLAEHLSSTYRSEINIGGRTFALTANPIITAGGERLGTVVEWADRTDEVTIQREIDEVISAATQGNLAVQINMAGKQGFFADLSKGLNSLVSTIEVAVNDIVRVLGAMAKGDLTERVTRDYEGSFGQLKEDVNLTTEKLTEVIGNIRQSSNSIASAANEISQGNADLSQRTEEQASALEETASSMEEMTSTVRQSAENAMSANSLAMEAQEKAKQGGSVVSKAVVSMEEINKASKRIADIIGVIDEIAFQTNLLALNAAVEAARAGEQGRGFAVVAGEVRNLAQRSAGAAKEIKDLIRDSVTKVEDGSQLVNASGETLQQIVAAVEKVTAIMRDISDAAQEQTSGIEQVNTAVSEMDEMTQQNAALVEQATAAGESMAEQASSMNRMMDFFTVSHASHGSHVSHAPKPTAVKAKPGATKTSGLPSASGYSGGADGDEWEEF